MIIKIYAEGMVHRGHRLNGGTLIYWNAEFYDYYDFRRRDGTQRTLIKLENTGFFPGGKS